MPPGGDGATEVPAQGRDWRGLFGSLFVLNKRRGRKGPQTHTAQGISWLLPLDPLHKGDQIRFALNRQKVGTVTGGESGGFGGQV